MIYIDVVYANTEQQKVINLKVDVHCTIEEAVKQSGLMNYFPEIDLTKNKVGIFSEICPLHKIVSAYDRVEIYRPLRIDPMAARRNRARQQEHVFTVGNAQ